MRWVGNLEILLFELVINKLKHSALNPKVQGGRDAYLLGFLLEGRHTL